MTPRRAEVLDLVRAHQDAHGSSPSLTELATKLGVHKSTILRHLRALEVEGLVQCPKGVHRGVTVVDAPSGNGVEPELVKALFEASWEIQKGLASMDLERIRRAGLDAGKVADAWMKGNLKPRPPVPEEGCAEVAPLPTHPESGRSPIPV